MNALAMTALTPKCGNNRSSGENNEAFNGLNLKEGAIIMHENESVPLQSISTADLTFLLNESESAVRLQKVSRSTSKVRISAVDVLFLHESESTSSISTVDLKALIMKKLLLHESESVVRLQEYFSG